MTIQPERIQPLQNTTQNARGRYVLYWMQQSQRVRCNHALEFAVKAANERRQPLMVIFGLTETYPEANWRHYTFMLEGLQDVQRQLASRCIAFQVRVGEPVTAVLKSAEKASLIVCDLGYMRHQRQWRRKVAHSAPCPVVQVESDVLVPVAVASTKAEYAARTIRSKIMRQLPGYLVPLQPVKLKQRDLSLADPVDFEILASRLHLDRSVAPVSRVLSGGYTNAIKQFKLFTARALPDYHRNRNHPHIAGSSMMSPFLHFGHISPVEIALSVQNADISGQAKNAFMEELIVRRELAVNHVFYRPDYDRFSSLPNWARQTLAEHIEDNRNPVYSPEQLEAGETDDPYWNTAMLEMKHTGYMHTYMRMYWGKKILQWRPRPEDAFDLTLRLNNKYFIDGRDPNTYAGVGWIYGLHDQAWKERRIFGKVRYMARSGLERKFDMPGYVSRVRRLIEAAGT